MTRSFVAVDIPESLAQQLAALQEQIAVSQALQTTLVDQENLHVTLAFLGELDDDQLSEVQEDLAQVEHEAFTTRVQDITLKDRRIVWASLTLGSWQQLSDAVSQVLPSFTADRRDEFHPHITLARVKDVRDATAARGLIDALETPEEEFVVDGFSLYTSQLTPQGPVYAARASYGLD